MKDNKKLEKLFEEKLAEQFYTGIFFGSKTVAQVVKDKIVEFKNEDNPIQLLAEIEKFCDTTLDMNQKEFLDTNTNKKKQEQLEKAMKIVLNTDSKKKNKKRVKNGTNRKQSRK